jgi:flagellin
VGGVWPPQSAIEVQAGVNNTASDHFPVGLPVDATAGGLGISDLSFLSADGARAAMDRLDTALAMVSEHRGRVGAMSNRMQSAAQGLLAAFEAESAARSRIADADVATTTAELALEEIRLRTATALFVQSSREERGRVLALLVPPRS